MKKTYLWKAIVLFAGVLAIGCNKEQNLPEEQTPNEGELKMVTETISAVADEGSTKVQIAESDAAFSWSEADKVAVHATDGWYLSEGLSDTYHGETSATFTVTYSGDRDAFAIFPYTLVYDTSAGDFYANSKSADGSGSNDLTVNLPSSYALAEVSDDKAPCPMIATNTGSGWTFRHLCGLLRLTVNSVPATATELTIDFLGRKVHGDFTIVNGKLDPGEADCVIGTVASGNDVITITGLDGSSSSVTVNIPLPTGDYDDVVITPYNGSTQLDVMAIRHIKGSTYSASRAHRRKLTTTLVSFTVDANGKKVVFAPGNLQATYDGTNWAWHFAGQQYDYIGNNEGNTLVTDVTPYISAPGTVDLFGFSTNTNYFGITSSLDKDDSGYRGDYVEWGSNAIGNYPCNFWRTLTARPSGDLNGEWYYVLYRKSSYYEQWGHATVESIQGIIILPDEFTDPKTNENPSRANKTFLKNDTGSHSYNDNVYTGTNWEAMEAAGAVFLPVTMQRRETVFSDSGFGHYWSSTSNGDIGAFEIYFTGSSSWRGSAGHRYMGDAVRLVRDIPGTGLNQSGNITRTAPYANEGNVNW